VEERYAGTFPKKKTDKTAIIDYIIAHVARPGELKMNDYDRSRTDFITIGAMRSPSRG
jgi:hypothetical protein